MTITESLLYDFLPKEETAVELGVCERTLDRWRNLGEGPPITKLGRRVFYRRSSVRAWLARREHHELSGEDAANNSNALKRRGAA